MLRLFKIFSPLLVALFVSGQAVLARPTTNANMPDAGPAAKSAAKTVAKSGPKSGPDQREWLFIQQQAYSGRHKIYWTPNAVRISCEAQGYSLVCHAPDWKLYIFRDDDKVYRETTLPDFFKQYVYHQEQAAAASEKFLKLQTINKDGLDITRYRIESEDGGLQELYLVESPPVAPQVSDIILAYYYTRPARGVLYRSYHEKPVTAKSAPKLNSWSNTLVGDRTDRKDKVLTTEVKKLPYIPSDFECPKGYKAVRAEELYTSKAQKKQAESLIQDMDLGGKFGAK